VIASGAVRKACIYVLAGPNGGGKSSILGEMMLQAGSDYINPDVEADRIRKENPAIPLEQANSIAWKLGRDLLERAIREQMTFVFETTLGGNTITELLERSLSVGIEVRISFVCLATVEMHLKRIRSRVRQGGHDIPEQKVRERYERSRWNVIRLLPSLTELKLYDNSFEADFGENVDPKPRLILHCAAGRIIHACELKDTPEWAKPIVEVAIRVNERNAIAPGHE